VVHGRVRLGVARLRAQLARLVERPEHGDAVEGEPEVGREPRDGEHEHDGRDRDARPIERRRRCRARDDPSSRSGERENDGDRDAEGWDRVHRLRVEVGLIDDPGPEDRGAQRDPDDCRDRF
jgi:hypothetical protein